MATHGSSALPGVAAMPTGSKPSSSPRRAMRAVYSGVYGQKKKPTRIGGVRVWAGGTPRGGRGLLGIPPAFWPEKGDGGGGGGVGGGAAVHRTRPPPRAIVLRGG